MINSIDKSFQEAWKLGLNVIGIKLTIEEHHKFIKELLTKNPHLRQSKHYKGARIIRGYIATIDGKRIESGLMCAYIFNDHGIHAINHSFIPLSKE